MKRLAPWLAPGLMVGVSAAYLLNPGFCLAVNQLSEMLNTGNSRGLMMFYHSAGNLSPFIATGIGVLAFMVPILKPMYLHQANSGFFGAVPGALITLLSATVSLGLYCLLACSVGAIIPKALRDKLKQFPKGAPVFMAVIAAWFLFRL